MWKIKMVNKKYYYEHINAFNAHWKQKIKIYGESYNIIGYEMVCIGGSPMWRKIKEHKT